MQASTSTRSTGTTPQRGRGRPRVENPLTPAERARRYRLKKKSAPGPAPGAGVRGNGDAGRAAELEREVRRLRECVAGLQQWMYDATGAFEQILLMRERRKGITAEVIAGVERLLDRPVPGAQAAAMRKD